MGLRGFQRDLYIGGSWHKVSVEETDPSAHPKWAVDGVVQPYVQPEWVSASMAPGTYVVAIERVVEAILSVNAWHLGSCPCTLLVANTWSDIGTCCGHPIRSHTPGACSMATPLPLDAATYQREVIRAIEKLRR